MPEVSYSRSRFRPLQDDAVERPLPDLLGERVALASGWRAARGTPTAADGHGYSKLGWAVAQAIATCGGLDDPTAVDIGLVRMLEAASADHDRNVHALSRLRSVRTTKGVLIGAELLLFSPLLLPALTNGRALRRLLAEYGQQTRVVTRGSSHDVLRLPRLDVGDAEIVRKLEHANDELLGLAAYQGEDRDLVDSILINGVQEPPVAIPTWLRGDGDEAAWAIVSYEGARRTFGAQSILTGLTGMSAKLWGRHWRTLDGADQLRDLTPPDFDSLFDRLGFPDSSLAAILPASPRRRDVEAWRRAHGSNEHLIAFLNALTMPVFVAFAVAPRLTSDAGVWDVVAEMVRSQHVRGKAKRMWALPDVEGLAAIEAIDKLVDEGELTGEEKEVALGATSRDWALEADDDAVWPSRLRVVAHLMALLVNNGDGRERIINQVLRDNGRYSSPDERARIAAAQVAATLGITREKYEGQVVAALVATFRDPIFYAVNKHGDLPAWKTRLDDPADELLADALEELHDPGRRAGFEAAGDFGPAQRALGALGIAALETNPALIDADIQLTRTGRGGTAGGRGRVGTADPSTLVRNMMQRHAGLRQLHAAIRATEHATPSIPRDPDTDEELTDRTLRATWLTGEAPPVGDEAQLSPRDRWMTDVDYLVSALEQHAATARELYDRPEDPDAPETTLLFRNGISESTAARARRALDGVQELFVMGHAIAGSRSRADV